MDLEQKLTYVEKMFVKYGALPLDINKKNRQKFDQRRTFQYKDSYYRADTAEFDGQLFIVISSIDDPAFAEIGIMEDIEAFPWDISDDMLEKEVRYVLEIDPEPVTFL